MCAFDSVARCNHHYVITFVSEIFSYYYYYYLLLQNIENIMVLNSRHSNHLIKYSPISHFHPCYVVKVTL